MIPRTSTLVADGVEIGACAHEGEDAERYAAERKLSDAVRQLGVLGALRAMIGGAGDVLDLRGDAITLSDLEADELRLVRAVLRGAIYKLGGDS